jgi:hypothetical protein
VLPASLGWTDWKDWYKKNGMFAPLRQFVQYNDTLLLHYMAPNRPDIALIAGAVDVNSDSDPDAEDEDDEDDEDDQGNRNMGEYLRARQRRNQERRERIDQEIKRRRGRLRTERDLHRIRMVCKTLDGITITYLEFTADILGPPWRNPPQFLGRTRARRFSPTGLLCIQVYARVPCFCSARYTT